MSSLKLPVLAWNLLLSRKKEVLQNHLAQIVVTPNHQGTFELRQEDLSGAGVLDQNTSDYDLSHLDDLEAFWENPQFELDVLLKP